MKRIVQHTERVVLALLVGTSTLGAQASPQPQGQPAAKPAAAPAQKDRYAKIRKVNLANEGKFWVGFSGQVRERVESWGNFNFGALPAGSTLKTDDMFAMTRLYLAADVHAGSRVRVFAQGKSSLSTNRQLVGGRRTVDVDEIDAHQLYGELRFAKNANALAVQGGRFEMGFGRGRLVSNLDWANTARSFEGVKAAYSKGPTTVTGFYTYPVNVRFYRADRRDSSTRFFGAYGTTRRGRLGADLYWMGQRRDAAVWNGTIGRENRHTVGTRLWGPPTVGSAIDLEAEAAFQFGEVGTNNVQASMFTGVAGYTFRKVRRAPRVYASVDYASGDDAAGGDVGTFSQLNPQPHPFLGYGDVVGRQNVVDFSGGTSATLWRSMTGAIDYHVLRRASAGDAYYSLPGGVARAATFGTSKAIGSNLDFTLRYPVDRYSLLMAGWSYVLPGQMIKQGGGATGADKNINFLYLMVQHTL